MDNKQTIIDNNARIEALTKRVSQSGVGYKDMLQERVDATNSCYYLFSNYQGSNVDYISNLDISNVTNMNNMFSQCGYLISIPLLDTGQVTSMESMFSGCSDLTSIPALNTSNVTNMSNMFAYCSKLTTIPQLDTSKVIKMSNMFNGCSKLTTIPQLDTSSCENAYSMFGSCSKLTTVPPLDIKKCTNAGRMFDGCTLLTTIPLLDLINKPSVASIFASCRDLTNLTLKNIRTSIQLGFAGTYGYKLTDESLINTAKELWDLTGSTSQTLTVSSTFSIPRFDAIYVKLIEATEDMIAEDEYITNKKPCVVCESTDTGAMTLREYVISKNWSLS